MIAWPTSIAFTLNRRLPARFRAEPGLHRGASFEIDVSPYDTDESGLHGAGTGAIEETGGGAAVAAVAVWAPPRATFEAATALPDQDEFAVLVYDRRRARRLSMRSQETRPRRSR